LPAERVQMLVQLFAFSFKRRTDNFANALGLFSSSQDDFDLWFKRRLAESTGVDLNTPPEMSLPELLSSYSAAVPA
jgi:hypothetical protein